MVLVFVDYDHVHIIVQPETSSYSLSYFAPIGHIDPKYLCSPILEIHLNCTKGTYNSNSCRQQSTINSVFGIVYSVFKQQVYWYLLVCKCLVSEYYCNSTC